MTKNVLDFKRLNARNKRSFCNKGFQTVGDASPLEDASRFFFGASETRLNPNIKSNVLQYIINFNHAI